MIGSKSGPGTGCLGELRLTGIGAIINAKSIKSLSAIARDNHASWRSDSPEIKRHR